MHKENKPSKYHPYYRIISEYLLIIFVLIFSLNSGCAPPIKSIKITSNDISKVKIGLTTKKDISKIFGLPYKIIKADNDNRKAEVWVYLKDSVINRTTFSPSVNAVCGNIRIRMGSSHYDLGVQQEEVQMLFEFNESDILSKYKINNGAIQ